MKILIVDGTSEGQAAVAGLALEREIYKPSYSIDVKIKVADLFASLLTGREIALRTVHKGVELVLQPSCENPSHQMPLF